MSDVSKNSYGPHIHSGATTGGIMLIVLLALMPAWGFGVFRFGFRALLLTIISVGAAVLTELLFGLCRKKVTVTDLSAVVTGFLLAMNLPVGFPLWMTAVGAVFAVLAVKLLFGGLGKNLLNPAASAVCALMLAFPERMMDYRSELYGGLTPLAAIAAGENVNVLEVIIGKVPGAIGTSSMLAILAGACILLLFGVIDLHIPGSCIVTFLLVVGLLGGRGFEPPYLVAQLAGGSLMLVVFFMAVDYTTRPVTVKGQYIYGILMGALFGLSRVFDKGENSIFFVLLLLNLLVPLIDRVTRPVAFGKGIEYNSRH